MASTGDKITDTRNAARPNSARVTSGRSAAGSTLACDNLAGWPTASKVHFVTYTVDSNSNPVAGSQLDCYGIVSGNNINSFTVVDGTDTGNSVGDYVEMLPTAAWGQDLADALTNQHTRTGAHSGITNTGGLTTDTLAATGNSTVGGTLGVTGATTLTGAVGGAGYSLATISNPYKFSAYRNAAANTGSGAFAKVTFDTELFDTSNNFATGTFTAPIAGFYQFSWIINTGANVTDIVTALYKNGSAFQWAGETVAGSGIETSSNGSVLVQSAANDTWEVYVFANAAVALNVGSTKNNFSGFLVSAT